MTLTDLRRCWAAANHPELRNSPAFHDRSADLSAPGSVVGTIPRAAKKPAKKSPRTDWPPEAA